MLQYIQATVDGGDHTRIPQAMTVVEAGPSSLVGVELSVEIPGLVPCGETSGIESKSVPL